MFADIVNDIIDDLSSRQALAGAASVGYIVAAVVVWWWWTARIRRRRARLDAVVLVTGSRGKSSTVRALHAALSADGRPVHAKTTGTAAAELATDGSETPTRRLGQVSVLEILWTMSRALRCVPTPRHLVFECMAVKPKLISLIARRMLVADIVIITNTRVDHLEDEGSSLEEIAASMAEAVIPGCLVVTGEEQDGLRDVIRRTADERGATFLHATSDLVPPETFARLPAVHPQNVAFVFAVTRHLGIDDEVAVRGMARASKEPGEREVFTGAIGGLDVVYTDLGAINDPVSLVAAVETFPWPVPRSVPRIGLVTGRWDRPLRDLSFVGCLDRAHFDGLILVGGPVHRMRNDLIGAGWSADRVTVPSLFERSTSAFARRLIRLATTVDPGTDRIVLIGLENEHEAIADRIRTHFRRGERVPVGADGGQEVLP